MASSFYFYDLETSGINARTSRIMQFAGQRTDMKLKPIAEPDNMFVRLSDDVLPDPDAILITGITPQRVSAEGVSEAEFLAYFHEHVALPDTIFIGFNNIRFDDEFMRFTNYRNFFDAYEWSWRDGRSRWDMLDVLRMTRALRPAGIEWPYDVNGRPSNRLELMTSVNRLEHADAHDALSDVQATIALARLVQNKQPKLFEYLLKMRDKKEVAKLACKGEPFIYSSGKYPSAYHKTTIVKSLGNHPGKQGILAYDLRVDPDVLKAAPPAELAKLWQERVEDETKRFPVKVMQFNRCPAIAPLAVLDVGSQKRLQIDLKIIRANEKKLKKHKDLFDRLVAALKLMDSQRQSGLLADEQAVDGQLYDGFFSDQDRTAMSVVRAAEADEIGSLGLEFEDQRLNKLLPLYKARNFTSSLTHEERVAWEQFRYHKLMDGGDKSVANRYFMRLSDIAQWKNLTNDQQYLLEELQLYGESILPENDI